MIENSSLVRYRSYMLSARLSGPMLGFVEYDASVKFRGAHVSYDNSGAFGVLPVGFAGGNLWDDVPGDRHNRGVNLSFVDGHAEYHRWRARKGRYGDRAIGDDLLDLHWLQDRVPAR